VDPKKIKKLRILITENLRVQRGGAKPIPYIDVGNVLLDAAARQNHAVFGRHGCGKTLLLHHSAKMLPEDIKPIYLNCEDFKKHSFPNVLIEILDALFGELKYERKNNGKKLVATGEWKTFQGNRMEIYPPDQPSVFKGENKLIMVE
jgi:predicted AAA+ superfamily ATPase